MAARPRIAVVGAGWWSTLAHLPALAGAGHAELAALVDPDPQRLSTVSERFGVTRTHADHTELLAAGGIDGLIVSTPHTTHYRIARDALEAGIHVLVEKPMTLRAWEAWDLVARAERRGLRLMVGYTAQFTARAAHVEDLVRHRIGELVAVQGLFASSVEILLRGRASELPSASAPVLRPNPDTYADPALAGGGQGQTQATHLAGMIFSVTGKRAVDVAAFMEHRDLPVDLADAISWRFDGGGVGSLLATGTVAFGHPNENTVRYYGTDGLVIQDFRSGKVEAHLGDGTLEALAALPDDEAYPVAAPALRFAEGISGGGGGPAPGSVGAMAVEFLEAAYRSAAEGRPVSTEEVSAAPRG